MDKYDEQIGALTTVNQFLTSQFAADAAVEIKEQVRINKSQKESPPAARKKKPNSSQMINSRTHPIIDQDEQETQMLSKDADDLKNQFENEENELESNDESDDKLMGQWE